MAEEEMVGNVKQKNEKRLKAKSKKDKMSDASAMPLQEVQKMKAIESVRIFEKEDVSDAMRDRRRGQKKNKNEGIGDAEADINKDSSKSKLTDVNGKKKKKKSPKNENEKDAEFESNTEEAKGNGNKKWLEGESVSGKESCKKVEKEWKKKKVKINNVDVQEGEKDGEAMGTHSEDCETNATEMIGRKKKKKEKKNKHGDVIWHQGTSNEAKPDTGDLSATQQENLLENVGGDVLATMAESNATKKSEKKEKKKHKKKENYKEDSSSAQQDSVDNDCSLLTHAEQRQTDEGQRKKKKTKVVENGSHDGQDTENADRRKKRKTPLVENGSSDATPTPAKSNKKVRFSGDVEVFPLPDESNTEKGNDEDDNLVKGKRFTPEENEIVKDAVLKYIEEHELGEEGLDMVMNCSKYPKLKGCWQEIGAALPHRPRSAIYYRARVLFMRSETRKWTQEEYDMILKHHEEHGSQWRALADELGKHTWHVKDTYRRIKLPNLQKGKWSQEEYQKLFNLVNTDLQLKIAEEKKSKHGMLRDNISWSAISDELSTRNQSSCCVKWYKQLTSPMVAEGVWADSDDYRMLSALYSLDATCLEDVDWDDLVENRSGDTCRRRWNQMVMHIGQHGNKSFAEQVEVLAQRYCPHLLEVREIWDSKPRVP